MPRAGGPAPPAPPPGPGSPSADLSIDKQDTGFDPVTVGDDITYMLVVTNSGPTAATNVHVTDTLPAGLTFDSSPDGCTESAGVVDCDFGTVASGATETQTFVVNTTAAAVPSVTNTATVDGDEADPDPSGNSDSESTTVGASATCKGRRATLVGTAGKDRLVGTPGADVMVALGGNDVVLGGGGNDLICTGTATTASRVDWATTSCSRPGRGPRVRWSRPRQAERQRRPRPPCRWPRRRPSRRRIGERRVVRRAGDGSPAGRSRQ